MLTPIDSFSEHKIENLVYMAVKQQLRVTILKVIFPDMASGTFY
jgi:hypothetical protein